MIDGINNYGSYGYEASGALNYSAPVVGDGGKTEEKELTESEIRSKKRSGEMECQTCKSRRYVDGSDDEGVSFQTPQYVSPEQSASAVISHEREHYNRETSSAKMNNEEILSASISVSRKTCPECGKMYVSGGLTRVTKRVDTDKKAESDYFNNKFYQSTVGKHLPNAVDKSI